MNDRWHNFIGLGWDNSVRKFQGRYFYYLATLSMLLLVSCQPLFESESNVPYLTLTPAESQLFAESQQLDEKPIPLPTPFPTRPSYAPGELVTYNAQVGDTLDTLAIRFNTSITEIMEANTFIPNGTTTLPPGMPMQIPIYYEPFWGSPYQIIPDSVFVNGPSQVGFDTQTFVDTKPGWLSRYSSYVAGENRTGAQVVDLVATNFSISPQLLLALLEYQAGALSQATLPSTVNADYFLGYEGDMYKGMYLQLVWAADMLNHGYYCFRNGRLETLYFSDGTIENIDPWQNAATASLQYFFSVNFTKEAYLFATGSEGLAKVFLEMFGDPWENPQPHLPGSLQQPLMHLPFQPGKTWAYTGGPHTGWGTGEPWAAIDFAPPSTASGCIPSNEWATAVADGVVARTGEGILELDLDGDGDPRTGWVVFYLHVAEKDRVIVGTHLQAGQPLGHPSCEGGTSTGTHIHIARKYNGEWIAADGILPFNLDGWVPHNGENPYSGLLTRFSETVIASTSANQASYITAEEIEN